jgi:hypothetical protein
MDFKGPGPPATSVRFNLTSTQILLLGALAFTAGGVSVALDSTGWYYSQEYFAIFDQKTLLGLVLRYYIFEGLAIATLAGGAFLIYKGMVSSAGEPGSDSIRSMIAEALRSSRDVKVGVAAAIVYGAVYLFVSSVVVFQPTVNFATAYGVTGATWNAAACCGAPGTVPALIVYLIPQAHLALQILPLDALFAVLVPILVGLNVAVASHSFRNKVLRANTGWLGSIGLLAGLFTGCPTCAGLFLAGAVGGFGATTLAVALAPFQLLFVVLSIPLLLASPLIVALYSRKAMRAACAVPSPKS